MAAPQQRSHLVVLFQPCWEDSVLGQADILVLLHGLIHAVHAQVLQVDPVCKTLHADTHNQRQSLSLTPCTYREISMQAVWAAGCWMLNACLAGIKNGSVACASAQIAIDCLFHFSRCAAFAFAVSNRQSGVAGNHHPRGAKATLRTMETSNALCVTCTQGLAIYLLPCVLTKAEHE